LIMFLIRDLDYGGLVCFLPSLVALPSIPRCLVSASLHISEKDSSSAGFFAGSPSQPFSELPCSANPSQRFKPFRRFATFTSHKGSSRSEEPLLVPVPRFLLFSFLPD